MASAVGNTNFDVEFAFPTSKEMGHPFLYNPKIEPWRSTGAILSKPAGEVKFRPFSAARFGRRAELSGEKQPVYDLDDGIDVPGHEPEGHDHQAYAKHHQATTDR